MLADPFGGMLRWRRDGPRSATLWSLGPDQQDDGGRPQYGEEFEASEFWDVVFDLQLPEPASGD